MIIALDMRHVMAISRESSNVTDNNNQFPIPFTEMKELRNVNVGGNLRLIPVVAL